MNHDPTRVSDVRTVVDHEGRIVDASSALCTLLGFAPSELEGRRFADVTHPDSAPAGDGFAGWVEAALERDTRLACRMRTREGADVWLDLAWRAENLGGEVRYVATASEGESQVVVTDGGARSGHQDRMRRFRESVVRFAEDALTAAEPRTFHDRLLRSSVDLIPGAQAGSMVVLSDDGDYRFVAAVGYDMAELEKVHLPATLAGFEHPPDLHRPRFVVRPRPAPESLDEASRHVFAEHGREDELVSVLVVPIVVDGRIEAFLTLDNFEEEEAFDADAVEMARVSASLAATILHRLRMEGALERLAFFDGLTGLPNRTLFLRRLGERCDRPRDPSDPLAVLLLDLDDLKPINDSFGHDIGDEVIRAIAARLESVVGDGSDVARIGGDEFVVVGDMTHGRAEALAERLLDEVHAPVFAADHALRTSASVGIALSPRHARTPSELLRMADVAMHHAKTHRSGRAVSVFRPEMDAAPLERVLLEEAMHAALEREEFVVHYQPRVRMDSGRIVGFEALVRWHHPDRGLVPPGLFVPLAESTRLIVDVGRYVLTRAARQARAWRDAGHGDLRVSVNLSAREVEDPHLESSVRSALETSGLAGDALEFEILERSAMHHLDTTRALLERLHAFGCQVALDDFGVGHSSLSYLQHLRVDTLKIDRSFLAGIDVDPSRRALVEAITRMGRTLGLVVVAEGVETLEQWRELREIGVDEAQGFLLSAALPASDAEALLATGPLLPAGLSDV